MADDGNDNYSNYWPVDTRGAGMLAIVACKKCGALVPLADDATETHDHWHNTIALSFDNLSQAGEQP